MIIHLRVAIVVVLIATLPGCARPLADEGPNPREVSWLSGCERPAHAALTAFYADSLCGTLEVPEDPDAADGRQISLAVMVTPALSRQPKPDPIFFLAGGPGQAARDVGPMVLSEMKDLRLHRDLVFVDQRGTGASNALDCRQDTGFMTRMGESIEAVSHHQVEWLKQCLGEIDADPSLYTTPIAMDDLDRVRRALGYDRINLYGISYGTRAALVYLRRHESSVRSVVLDSVAPLTMQIPAHMATDAERALDQLFSDCASVSSCNNAFPSLRLHFEYLIKRLRLAPEDVTLSHPRTGKTIETRMDVPVLTGLVRAVLYQRTLSSLLPFALEQAFRMNYQPLVTLAYSVTGDEGTLSIGMMASVLCSEDMRFMSQPDDDAKYFVNPLYDVLNEACTFWPRGSIDKDYVEPVTSDVPVLLVSGALDPVTPPVYADEAAKTLSRSRQVVVPGVGHGASIYGCMPDVLERFIAAASVEKLDTQCVQNLSRPPFFTGYAGPVSLGEAPAE